MASAKPLTGVLCMAYGSPAGEAEIEAYYTSIRGGRKPPPEALEELKGRYRAIGGSSLTAITHAQAAALEKQLGLPVFVGMKHAAPFIEDGAAAARAAGIERLVGLPLAPHYSRISLGSYERALNQAWDRELIFIPGFHAHPAFITAVRGLLSEALATSRPERIYFSAHSLPARIIAEGDPYREQLLDSCRLVAAGLDLPDCEFAFQSASKTGEPWLGPDVLEALERARVRDVLVCPIGFVADHLEILYDLDVEARAFARERGISLRRTASFNDRPDFIAALASVVLDAIENPLSAVAPAARVE
jgi:protoporphyrin/coproporphyrin ferrochelatase